MSEPCPRCSRPNASFRTTCLYCGAKMPNPTARPAEPQHRAPDNLDELVRDAMRGGGTEKLKAALTRPDPPAGDPRRPPEPLAVPMGRSAALVRSAPLVPWTDRLVRAAQRAALLGGDPASLLEVLLEAEEALDIGFSSLPDASPTLPPFRQPWMLVLPPLGQPEEIGLSLGVDQATARMLAQGRWPRIGLRGESPTLGRRAGFDQIAISRDELMALPAPMGVLASSPSPACRSEWQVTDEPIWLDDPRGGGVAARFENVLVIVPGEVETRTTREAPSENRWLRKRLASAGAGTERRVRVIDVHTERAIFRLVEGVTRTDAIPGTDPNSARKAFTRALEHLVALHDEAEVIEERLCNVGGDGKSAWPAWEEHTRVARLYTQKRRELDERP